MKKLLFLILVVFLFSCEKNDPNENIDIDNESSLTWEKLFGGSDSDNIKSVQQTTDGGYIIAGSTASFGAGKVDGWLIKTDENGNEQWSQTFGGSDYDYIWSVQQTTDGGYILAGWTKSFGDNGWLIKTDESGNEQWSQTFEGSDYDDYISSVKQTTDGGYVLAGSTQPLGIPENDGWLIKTDERGNEQWSQTFGGSDYDWIFPVQQTTDGGYILAGSTQSFGTDHYDGWLIKTNKSGNEQWSKTFFHVGSNGGSINSVQQSKDRGYILAGHTIFPGVGTGDYDGWLIKTDESGNKKWSQTFEGNYYDNFNSVQQTSDGGYILAGYTAPPLTINHDGWLIKTDESGNKQWSQIFGGSDFDEINSVQQTTDGGYIVAGHTTFPGVDGGNYDGWLIKTDENGEYARMEK